MAFKDILRKKREEAGENQTELGNFLGITPQMVSKLETGRSQPSAQFLQLLSKHFNISIEELLGLNSPESQKTRKIPIIGKISAGRPILADENIVGYYPLLPGIHGDFILKVVGDSMEPIIPEGSYIVVRSDPSIHSGQMGVFLIDSDSAVVKRIYYDSLGIILKSENSKYPPRFISKSEWENQCRAIGKVSAVIRNIEEETI